MKTLTTLLTLSYHSLLNRRLSVGLNIFAIAVSVVLVLGVEKIRHDARLSFTNTISGTDLIVGARSGAVQLLLYSVFRIGNATNNISWVSYQAIAKRKDIKWTIPISLGDSHRGFRVMGTTTDYFSHYRYGAKKKLPIEKGVPFKDVFETVLGADVASALDYKVGDEIILSHGLGKGGFSRHKDKPFRVSGVLAWTGTPVDRTVHVSLAGIEAIHVDWKGGTKVPGLNTSADELRKMKLRPKSITAFLVGLNSRLDAFRALRDINAYRTEPLLAILPGVALQELWDLMSTAEAALSIIAACVVAGGLLGMLTLLLASLNERRREMSILRAVGAQKVHVFSLFVSEAMLITLLGCIFGVGLLYAILTAIQPLIEARVGLHLSLDFLTLREGFILLLILGAGTLSGFLPAFLGYRNSVADGMTVRT